MSIQPKTKTYEAYEYLKNYQGLTNPDNVLYVTWLKDAELLLKSNPKDAYILKSFAYILLGKPSDALYTMRNARKLGSDLANHNIMSILYSMGQFEESAEIATDRLKNNPYDEDCVRALLNIALINLDSHKIKEAMRYYKGNNQKIIQLSQDNIERVDYRLNILNVLDISKHIFINISQYIYLFLSDKYVGNFDLFFDFGHTEVGGYVQVKVSLNNLTIDECLALQDSFLDMLIESELDYQDYKNILVNFTLFNISESI